MKFPIPSHVTPKPAAVVQKLAKYTSKWQMGSKPDIVEYVHYTFIAPL